jgi:D-methionine transport system substrate-binding protein
VTDGLQEVSGGTAELVKTPVADLEAALEETEQETAAQQ